MTREIKVKILLWVQTIGQPPLALEWWSLDHAADDLLDDHFKDHACRVFDFRRLPTTGLVVAEGTLQVEEDECTFYLSTRLLKAHEHIRIARNLPFFRKPEQLGSAV